MQEEILNAIPHRPPFLFVDEIVEQTDDHIITRKRIEPDEPFFKGHYPNYPIMPGVLVCECVFQSGALLVAKRVGPFGQGVPVMARISNVKFKKPVLPGDVLEMTVDYVEQVGPAHYMKGKASANGKTVLTVEFTAMLTGETP